MMAAEEPGVLWAAARLTTCSVAGAALADPPYPLASIKGLALPCTVQCISWMKCADLYANIVIHFKKKKSVTICNFSDYFVVNVSVALKQENWYKRTFTLAAKYGIPFWKLGNKSKNITIKYGHRRGDTNEVFSLSPTFLSTVSLWLEESLFSSLDWYWCAEALM